VTQRIDAARLYLRPLTRSDCSERYVAWLNDPQVNRYLETRFAAQNLKAIADFVDGVNGRSNEHLLGIFLRSGNVHIGNVKLGPINPHHRLGDISLFVGERSCWGKGYATEAIAAASRFAFDALAVRKLSAGMYAPNIASYRAFVSAGYREEARRPGHYLLDGKPCDILELGCRPEDLQ
jgi:RimJ/RimL family protein N-acetyltransferase